MVTTAFKANAFAQDTDEVILALLTIDHATLGTPIRVVNNNENITSNGNVFIGYPFDIILPDDRADTAQGAQLKIDNVDKELVSTIRTITTKATVTIQVIRASAPDTIERTFPPFDLRNVKWTALDIVGDLTIENMYTEPFPAGQFSPAYFPGMF